MKQYLVWFLTCILLQTHFLMYIVSSSALLISTALCKFTQTDNLDPRNQWNLKILIYSLPSWIWLKCQGRLWSFPLFSKSASQKSAFKRGKNNYSTPLKNIFTQLPVWFTQKFWSMVKCSTGWISFYLVPMVVFKKSLFSPKMQHPNKFVIFWQSLLLPKALDTANQFSVVF